MPQNPRPAASIGTPSPPNTKFPRYPLLGRLTQMYPFKLLPLAAVTSQDRILFYHILCTSPFEIIFYSIIFYLVFLLNSQPHILQSGIMQCSGATQSDLRHVKTDGQAGRQAGRQGRGLPPGNKTEKIENYYSHEQNCERVTSANKVFPFMAPYGSRDQNLTVQRRLTAK